MFRTLRVAASVGILWVLGAASKAQEPVPGTAGDRQAALEALAGARLDLDLKDRSLEEFAELLARAAGVTVTAEGPEDRRRSITLRLRNVSALDALRLVLDHFDLPVSFVGGAVLLGGSARPEADREELFDLAPLMGGAGAAPLGRRDLFGVLVSDVRPAWGAETPLLDGDSIQSMIRDEVAPDSWRGPEDRWIRILDDRLVARNAPSVLAEVRSWLRRLELQLGPAVRFRVRPLRVPRAAARRIVPGAVLDADESAALERAASGLVQPWPVGAVTVLNGLRGVAALGAEHGVVLESDGSQEFRDTVRDGLFLEIQPLWAGTGAVPCRLRVSAASFAEGPRGLPRMPFLRYEAGISLPPGAFVPVAVGTDPHRGETGEAEHAALVLLLSADPEVKAVTADFWGNSDPANEAAWELMRSRRLTLECDAVPLEAFLHTLGGRAGLNFVIHPGVRRKCAKSWLVAGPLAVRDAPVGEILDAVLRPKFLSFQVGYGVIHVVTRDEPARKGRLGMRDFPVHDLVAPEDQGMGDDLDPFLRPHGADPGPPPFWEEGEPLTCEALADLVVAFADPDSWSEATARMQVRLNRLLVWNRPETLRKVHAILEGLRGIRWSPVRIQGAFLDVALEGESGVDRVPGLLDAAACERLERLMESGTIRFEPFSALAVSGRDLVLAGGTQETTLRAESERVRRTVGLLNGWVLRLAFRPGAGGAVGIAGEATTTGTEFDPDTGALKRFERLRMPLDAQLRPGCGVFLGACGEGPGRTGLYLRLR